VLLARLPAPLKLAAMLRIVTAAGTLIRISGPHNGLLIVEALNDFENTSHAWRN
jgi:hypothetical protein